LIENINLHIGTLIVDGKIINKKDEDEIYLEMNSKDVIFEKMRDLPI